MNIFIFDMEVFEDDWILVARDPEEETHIVIHNDNDAVREFIKTPDILLGGFNAKGYDKWIVQTILCGGSPAEVKRCNDWIIKDRRNGWEFPFIHRERVPFKVFDLKDDLPKDLSLKAIEGNLGLPIVESSVPFDYSGKLSKSQLDDVIYYCKNDVDSTIQLYQARKGNYLDAKAKVAELYGLPVADALGMTNGRLSATVLEATYTERDDEREYIAPPQIDMSKIPDVVWEFFSKIHDTSIPNEKLFGVPSKGIKGMSLDVNIVTQRGTCPVTYAWGGLHGAKPCVRIEETTDRVIINQDVASLYPNSMINFGFTSRSMKDPNAYKQLVETRIKYKHAGQKTEANALKLVINTVYGCMLSTVGNNPLSDRLSGRSVCITNQLAMTMLIHDLSIACPSIDFVNINTDGIMFTIDRNEVDVSERVVAAWTDATSLCMERDDFSVVIQKDVNNYIGIKSDGHMKTKGGFISLYDGGNFKTNSLSVIHKAVVDYLVDGVPPEKTIGECKDMVAFQQIVKLGGTHDGAYQYTSSGEKLPLQKVNRIYAGKDNRLGAIVKGKWVKEKRRKNKETGKMESIPVDPPTWSESTIPECPPHPLVDNEMTATVDDLDLSYYIDMAKSRIDKYLTIDPKNQKKLEKIDKEIRFMASTTKAKNIYQKLSEARVKFLASPVKKTGVNRYAEFTFFQLEDIVPVATKIFNDVGLLVTMSITFEDVHAYVVNTDNTDEVIRFTAPAKDPVIEDGTKMSAIQGMGAYVTYQRRYLYMLILDIVEADMVDTTIGKENNAPVTESKPVEAVKATKRPATPEQREEIKKDLTDLNGDCTPARKKAISNGLKKLRAKDGEKYADYINATAKTVKGGINNHDADVILITIGKLLAE